MAKILLLNGPNLNLLGLREPAIYGSKTLAEIEAELEQHCKAAGHQLSCFQSNAEHELVDRIQQAQQQGVDWIIINAAALTHTSIALKDALSGVAIPFIEVHISNVYAREEYRHHSYLSAAAQGVIVGLGVTGYELALQAVFRFLNSEKK